MADETRGAGGFMPPRAAIPVAGPGVVQPGDLIPKPPGAPAAATAGPPPVVQEPPKSPRRKPAPKKPVAKKRPTKKAAPRKAKTRRRVAASSPDKASAAPAPAPTARRGRRGGPDLAKVMNVLGNAKRKDAPVINAVVQALSAVSRPARGRVLQAVTELFFG